MSGLPPPSPRKPPHFAAPLSSRQSQLVTSSNSNSGDTSEPHHHEDRVAQVQAMKLQKKREQLLMAQMEVLADTLCQQYLSAARAAGTPAGSSVAPPGGVPSTQEGASSSASPRLRTPDMATIQQIRAQIESMQFSIQQATVNHLDHHLQAQPPQSILRSMMQQRQDPTAAAAYGGASKPTPVLQLQRLIARPPAPPQQATSSTVSSQKFQRDFGHSRVLQPSEYPVDDALDLPLALKFGDRQGEQHEHDGATAVHRRTEHPHHPHGTLEGDAWMSNDHSDDFVPFVPNYNAVRAALKQDHGLQVMNVQPLLSSMASKEFSYLDASLDGNSRCLSHRRKQPLSKAEIALRSQPTLIFPAPPPTNKIFSMAHSIVASAPEAGYAQCQKKHDMAIRDAQRAAATNRDAHRVEWSPRDQNATKAIMRLKAPLS